jgi:hypothetical protein
MYSKRCDSLERKNAFQIIVGNIVALGGSMTNDVVLFHVRPGAHHCHQLIDHENSLEGEDGWAYWLLRPRLAVLLAPDWLSWPILVIYIRQYLEFIVIIWNSAGNVHVHVHLYMFFRT